MWGGKGDGETYVEVDEVEDVMMESNLIGMRSVCVVIE
jgi:hypothetical protein